MKNDGTPRFFNERFFLLFSGFFFSAISCALIFFGPHHVDEGYYHLIAQLTANGKMPYLDYFYVQTPLFPYIYGTFFKVFGTSFAAARTFSVIISLFTFLLAVKTARNFYGYRAAAVTAGIIVFQPFTLYYLMIVKLYAVTAFVLVLAVWALLLNTKSHVRYGLAAFLLSVATCIRLTIAPAIPLIILLSFLRTRKIKTPIFTACISIGTLLLILLPFYLAASDTIMYDIFGYHFDKESYSLARQFAHRIDTLLKISKLYFLPLLIAAVSVISFFFTKNMEEGKSASPKMIDALAVIGIIAAFHFTSQAPYVHRYLTMLIPSIAIILGPAAVNIERRIFRSKIKLGWMFGIACVMVLCGRGIADFGPIHNGGALLQLKLIANQIQMLSPPDKPILTFNNSVAVEAERTVVHGDEMNVLSYDPDWPENRCRQFGVLNINMLEQYINQHLFGAMLITKFSFLGNFPTFYNPNEEGARPRIMSAIKNNYYRVQTYPGFGYLGEDADLYIPKTGRLSKEQ